MCCEGRMMMPSVSVFGVWCLLSDVRGDGMAVQKS